MTNRKSSIIIIHALRKTVFYRSEKLQQKYSRGWRGAPAKGVGRVTGARVQIPLSALNFLKKIFKKFKKSCWQNLKVVIICKSCCETNIKQQQTKWTLITKQYNMQSSFKEPCKPWNSLMSNVWKDSSLRTKIQENRCESIT